MYQQQSFFGNIPAIVKNLLIINGLMFFATYLLSKGITVPGLGFVKYDLSDILGLYTPGSKHFHFFQYLTYMFMHGGFDHIFFNMFAVFMFGRVLERVWGPQKFLFYYLATGIGAGVLYVLVAFIRTKFVEAQLPAEFVSEIYENGLGIMKSYQQYTDPAAAAYNKLINGSMVGASGAVFGLLLAFGMLFPNEKIYLYMLVPLKAKWFVAGYGAIEIFLTLRNNPGDNVAHLAHLGGMLIGFFIIKFWRKKQF